MIDDDIPIRDANAINWAITFRCQPHRDVRIVPPPRSRSTPSLVLSTTAAGPVRQAGGVRRCSSTRRASGPIRRLSLPRREYMEQAASLWEQLGLGPLQLNEPWFGYPLGAWDDEVAEEAARAVEGRHWETGDAAEATRQKIDQ